MIAGLRKALVFISSVCHGCIPGVQGASAALAMMRVISPGSSACVCSEAMPPRKDWSAQQFWGHKTWDSTDRSQPIGNDLEASFKNHQGLNCTSFSPAAQKKQEQLRDYPLKPTAITSQLLAAAATRASFGPQVGCGLQPRNSASLPTVLPGGGGTQQPS